MGPRSFSLHFSQSARRDGRRSLCWETWGEELLLLVWITPESTSLNALNRGVNCSHPWRFYSNLCPLETGRFINSVAFLAAFSLVLDRGCKYIGHPHAQSKRTAEDTGAKGDSPERLLHSQTHFWPVTLLPAWVAAWFWFVKRGGKHREHLNRNKNLNVGQKWLFEYGTALGLFISRSETRKVRVENGQWRREKWIIDQQMLLWVSALPGLKKMHWFLKQFLTSNQLQTVI